MSVDIGLTGFGPGWKYLAKRMLALGDTRDVLIKGYLLTVFNVCQEGFVVTRSLGFIIGARTLMCIPSEIRKVLWEPEHFRPALHLTAHTLNLL